MKQERTWKDVVAEALQELGGTASLKEITTLAKKDTKAAHNTKVKEKVRQVVRTYKIFHTEEERSGIYSLIPDASTSISQQAATKTITDEIQGKLLYIGRVNNYETFAPADDRTKRRFAGNKLEHYVSVRDLTDHPRLIAEEIKVIEQIDVLWLTEIDGALVPRFAFEVEHQSKVIEGLNRLNMIPSLFTTRLFIIGGDKKRRNLYDKFLTSPTFKNSAGRFNFKYFNEVRELFQISENFDKAREMNLSAMKEAGLSD